jgi:hypothetical protein
LPQLACGLLSYCSACGWHVVLCCRQNVTVPCRETLQNGVRGCSHPTVALLTRSDSRPITNALPITRTASSQKGLAMLSRNSNQGMVLSRPQVLWRNGYKQAVTWRQHPSNVGDVHGTSFTIEVLRAAFAASLAIKWNSVIKGATAMGLDVQVLQLQANQPMSC